MKTFFLPSKKWPRGDWARPNCIIRVQQDGAKSHIQPDDPLLLQGLQDLEIEDKVLIYTQPPNLPDVNINDLGFFRALQSLYYNKYTPENTQQILAAVEQAYDIFETTRINRIWLTLMSCLNKIIEHGGDNDYKIPHMNKEQLERAGLLPIVMPVCETGVQLLTSAFF